MKITTSQLSFHTGNFEGNTKKMLEAIAQAKAEQTNLIVFAELATCGYPARDFLEFSDFIAKSNDAIHQIAKACVGIAAIVGAPDINPVPEGKDLYNAAYFLSDGEIKQVIHKTLLPNYDIFDEYRYFEPNRVFNVVNYMGVKLAITIVKTYGTSTITPCTLPPPWMNW